MPPKQVSRESVSVEQDSAYGSLFSVPNFPHNSQWSITCTKCNRTFSNPRVLPCLHTFCTKCLETTKKTVICPVCNVQFHLPPTGIRSLIPDYGIMNFISSIKGNSWCTSCRTGSSGAVAKCINCDNYLCHNCLLAHNYIHYFKGHHVIQFPEDFFKGDEEKTNALTMEGSFQAKEDENVMCIVHPESQVQLFCFTCNVPICQTCITEDHAGHRSDPIDTIGEALLYIMKTTMEENKSRLEDLADSIRSSHHIISGWNLQYKQVESHINKTYNEYSTMLLEHKQHQIQMLESSFNKLKATLHNSSNIYQGLYENTNRLTDLFSRLTKFGTVSQCLIFKKLLEYKHERLASYKPGPPLICNLKFVADGQDFTNVLNNTFGRVVCDIIPFENVSTGPSLDEISSFPKEYSAQGGTFPFKCDKWSNSCLENLKTTSDHNISSPTFRPYHYLKSTASRQIITYNYRFGSYGTLRGQFAEPNGVAFNTEGNIVIADTNNHRVQIFDKMGCFKFLFGEGSDSTDSGNLLFPNAVAVMEKTGDIIVTERAPEHQVQIYNQYGQFIRKFGENILQHPRAIAVDKDGNVIVVECKLMRVVIFDQQGEVVHTFTCTATLHFPNGVAVNDERQIFISDNRTHCVVVYDYHGNFIRLIGHEGLTNYPIGVMLNKAGHVIVADNHNHFNLTVFTQEGQLVTAVESKVKHGHCYDCALTSDGTIVLTCKNDRVYLYMTPF